MNISNFLKITANYIALVMLITSCSSKDEIAAKREELKGLKQQEAELALEISKLEKELESLDKDYEKQKLLLVETMTTVASSFSHSIEVHGTVSSDNNVQVNPEINGTIEDIRVAEGVNVAKGQVLAILNTDILYQSIKEVQTGLELANTVYEKQKRLWEQKVGTEVQFLEAKNRKEGLEKKLATLRTQLAMGSIKSPISGIVDEVFMNKGEMASPMLPLFRIVNTASSEIKADVSESYLGKIRKGDKVEVLIPANEKPVTGTITAVGQFINPGNRTFKVNVNIGKESASLKPNMLARVRINDYKVSDALVIPSDIIQYDQKGNYVFLVTPSGKEHVVKKVYIETGLTGNEGTVIKSGLKAGDVVVKKGHRALTDGEKVRINK